MSLNSELTESGKTKRTFLALELPGEFKEEIAGKIREMQESCPTGIKWVKKENLHITLQFLGNVGQEEIKKMSGDFAAILEDLKQFPVFAPEIEIVPTVNPRLIWVKCEFESPGLSRVVQRLRDYLKNIGFQIDKKPFRLHVTLGRVKIRQTGKQLESLQKPVLENRRWSVKEATFYESRLHSDGPEYFKIATFKLQEE